MRAVIYCRVSTQQQTKNLSLLAQQKECVAVLQAAGLDGGKGVRRAW